MGPFKFFSEKKNTMTATATGKARNYALASGVYRFGKGKMYHKKALYKKIKKGVVAKKVTKAAPAFIEKAIGGDKNGGKRMVRVKKLPAYYAPIQKGRKSSSKNFFSKHSRSLRPSLTPGTVCIVLAGVHKGKKTIFLKQLATGLCLITGPYKINSCPMRRINQNCLRTSMMLTSVGSRQSDPRRKREISLRGKPRNMSPQNSVKLIRLRLILRLLLPSKQEKTRRPSSVISAPCLD